MMEPLISIQIQGDQKFLLPGDVMTCDYQIDAVAKDDLQAVEVSVMWHTEGKGDEDLGVHYFERRVPADVEDHDLRAWRRFETIMPNSPLSYDGELLKVFWCVRVRAFLRQGRQFSAELPFQLGDSRFLPTDKTHSNTN
ncbi:MAG: hypothetical protein KDB27_24330 [Planctomycetales bacterium]|nr:hypothetical protein [Planctomycetales bacterium]